MRISCLLGFTVERWVPVVGFEQLYEVSNHGRVRTVEHVVLRSNGVPQTIKARMKTATTRRDRRRMVTLSSNRKSRVYLVHRLVAFAFLGSPQGNQQVNHVDGDPANNNLSNIEWVSPKENINHALDTGLIKNYGERQHGSKIKVSDVSQVISMARDGTKQRDIAASFGIHQSQVSRVISGKAWRRACLSESA